MTLSNDRWRFSACDANDVDCKSKRRDDNSIRHTYLLLLLTQANVFWTFTRTVNINWNAHRWIVEQWFFIKININLIWKFVMKMWSLKPRKKIVNYLLYNNTIHVFFAKFALVNPSIGARLPIYSLEFRCEWCSKLAKTVSTLVKQLWIALLGYSSAKRSNLAIALWMLRG